uniref:Hairy/enhancer of split related with yrpw motif 1 n=1 Tax=Rhipicephalus appendiculatus TaxID=34631 RepID=A0A131Z3P2_RHIAP
MDAGWEQALRLKMEQRSLNFCALERRRPQDMLEDAEDLGRKKAARVSVPSRRAWTSLCGRRGARDCSPSCGRPRPGARRLDWDRGHHRFGRVSAAAATNSRALLLGIFSFITSSTCLPPPGRAKDAPKAVARDSAAVTWRLLARESHRRRPALLGASSSGTVRRIDPAPPRSRAHVAETRHPRLGMGAPRK